MLESTALAAWRRRAGRGGRRGPVLGPRTAAVAVTAAVAAAALSAVLGGRVVQSPVASPSTTAGPTRCLPVGTALRADVDGDGCDEALAFSDGVLTAGAVHLGVGVPGDVVAVGRWTCGAATLALLRPATGEVFRFDGWAAPGHPVPAVTLGRVDGAVGLRVTTQPKAACDELTVSRRTGPPVIVPVAGVAG